MKALFYYAQKWLSPNPGKRLIFMLLMVGGMFSTTYSFGQSCTAPSQCMATPGFGEAPASHNCPQDFTADEIFLEDFNASGFGVFSELPAPGGTNDLTKSTNGDTPSFGTGPETTAGCNGGANDGEFVFQEGSFSLSNEKHCMEASIDIPATSEVLSLPFTMSFWYHMFGDNIGSMDIDINGNTEFTVSGQQQTANCQNWLQGAIDVSAHAGTTITMTVCMQEGNGSISTFESDISIDHIQIFGCKPILPEGWTSDDIGNSNNEFEYDFDTETFLLGSDGNNGASTTTDNVAFVGQQICGDGMITARVDDVSANAYAGLMIRESSAAGARQVSLFSNLTNVLRVESRSMDNAPKTVQAFYKPFPFWLRLQRQGDWIFAYYSSNGMSFSYVHAVYVPMSSCVEMGLAAFSTNNMPADVAISQVEVVGSMGVYAEGPTNPESLPYQFEGELQKENAVTIFPNPTKAYFTMQFAKPLERNAQVLLRNGFGQVVSNLQLEAGRINANWDVQDLASGLYYVEIRNDQTLLKTLRLVKQ